MRKSRRAAASDTAPTAPSSNFAWMYESTVLPGAATSQATADPSLAPPPAPVAAAPAWAAPAAVAAPAWGPPAPAAAPAWGAPALPPPASPYPPGVMPGGLPPGPLPHGWGAPPSGRKKPILIACAAVGVVVILAIVAAVVVIRNSSVPVSLPDQLGPLSTLNTAQAQVNVAVLVQEMRSGGSKHVAAKIYTADGLTQSADAIIADVPLSDQGGSNAAVNVVTSFTRGFTLNSSSPQPVAARPGPNGGYMVCGLRADSLASLSFCVWSDGKTISEVSDTHGTVAQAHALALAIRAANGH